VAIQTCRDLLALEFGDSLLCNFNESDVTVGTTAVTLVQGNGRRIWLTLTNWGAAAIAISTKPNVTATTGIIIPANGFLNINWRTDTDLPTSAIYAISSGAGNSVHITEQVLVG
jgi:hypothetical protein